MNEQQFYFHLRGELEKAFQKAPIKKKQEELNEKWYYLVCETRIQKGKGVLSGLNWGAEKGEKHQPQAQLPSFPYKNEELKWPYITLSLEFLRNYLNVDNLAKINYSNLCLFRSPSTDHLEWEDWKLTLQILKKYIDYINPPWVLLLGGSGIYYLNRMSQLANLQTEVVQGNKVQIFGYRGKLYGEYNFYSVPNPKYPIQKEKRHEIWNKVLR